MSPPMTPAPITCTARNPRGSCPPAPLSRSCSRNTRIRLRAVSLRNSAANDCASAAKARSTARAVAATTDRSWRRGPGSARAARVRPTWRSSAGRSNGRSPGQLRARSNSGGRCGGGAVQQYLPRCLVQLRGLLDQAIDQPELERPFRAHAAPGEHQVHGRAHARAAARCAPMPPKPGCIPSCTSGSPSASLESPARRGSGRRAPAPVRRRARSRGWRRRVGKGSASIRSKSALARADQLECLRRRLRSAGEFADVRAGDESRRLGGADAPARAARWPASGCEQPAAARAAPRGESVLAELPGLSIVSQAICWRRYRAPAGAHGRGFGHEAFAAPIALRN